MAYSIMVREAGSVNIFGCRLPSLSHSRTRKLHLHLRCLLLGPNSGTVRPPARKTKWTTIEDR